MELGRCLVTLAPLRKEPAHWSELSSQVLYGEWVRILEKGQDWMQVETEHRYTGWVRTRQFRPAGIQEAWSDCETGLYRIHSLDFFEPSSDGQFRLCYGALLTGREFQKFDLSNPARVQALNPQRFSGKQLARIGREFAGIPYLWGGRSSFGIDCSGLIQLIFNQLGYSFPRDAWQQALVGKPVEANEAQTGDLMFFARKSQPIHHVALYLGDLQYLHASEWVRIQSMNPDDSRYDKDRHETWTGTMRVSAEMLTSLAASYRRLISPDSDS